VASQLLVGRGSGVVAQSAGPDPRRWSSTTPAPASTPAQPFFYVRTLAEYAGGITQLMKSAHACEAFNANYEIHSYGPTLNLAMYLNVAFAIPNCDFSEIIFPQNVLSMGMATEDLPKVDDRGYIAAPQKPALG
jgi:hypothetical protein